jgi:integrase
MSNRTAPHTLTDAEVRGKSQAGLYGDLGNPNLYLRVAPGGSKSWVFRYWRNRRRHAIGLGPYPRVSLAKARAAAHEQRKLLDNGEDPAAVKRSAMKRVSTLTFEDCAKGYIAAHQAGWKTSKEAHEWTASMRIYAYPAIGKSPVEAIDLPLVLRVIEPLWQTKTSTGSRVRQRIENILDWATVRGHRRGDNPARWRGHLDQILPKPNKVAKVEHYAAMPYTEIGAFVASLRNARPALAARGLEFAILTAARVGEVNGATWSEIDLEARVWAIPADRMKAGKDHRVPLSAAALALLEALPRTGDRVFPVGDVALWRVAKKLRPDITVHGFRSSFRDWAGERTSYAREVVEQCLAHAAGDATELAYRRGDALEKRRQVMEAWAGFCAQPAPAGNVRAIRAATG